MLSTELELCFKSNSQNVLDYVKKNIPSMACLKPPCLVMRHDSRQSRL